MNQKMQDILDKHKFQLKCFRDFAIITYYSTFGVKHEVNIHMKTKTVDEFIKNLDKYYESIDLTEIIDNIYDGDLADTIRFENPTLELALSDIEKSYCEFERHLMALRNDLWENCPRIDSNFNDIYSIK